MDENTGSVSARKYKKRNPDKTKPRNVEDLKAYLSDMDCLHFHLQKRISSGTQHYYDWVWIYRKKARLCGGPYCIKLPISRK